jgi:hypothetical protein
MAPTAAEKELYLTPVSTPICVLDAKEAFDGLTGPKSLWILNCACCISIDLRIRRVSARQMQSAAATLP